jgi:hypothetical protein
MAFASRIIHVNVQVCGQAHFVKRVSKTRVMMFTIQRSDM